MKVPDSGMPDEVYWNGLFDIPRIVDWLDLHNVQGPIAEFGSGYGTFAIPIAARTTDMVHAFDIDPLMIETASTNARTAGVQNVRFHLRDIVEEGCALPAGSVALVLLFNILHSEHRRLFLAEASHILTLSGRIAIIHWRKDIETPRGPRQDLRPDRRTILNEISDLGLQCDGNGRILEPYHWGLQLIRGSLDEDRHHSRNK